MEEVTHVQSDAEILMEEINRIKDDINRLNDNVKGLRARLEERIDALENAGADEMPSEIIRKKAEEIAMERAREIDIENGLVEPTTRTITLTERESDFLKEVLEEGLRKEDCEGGSMAEVIRKKILNP
jgi:uncharacterized protein YydD (DUF2326 family)